VPPPAARDARIYIKRRGSRRVANDAMVENYLTALGFTSVYLENMAFAEQIALFASASFIVAMHGAALANLLFCQPGTRVLEISPDVEFRPYFWMIAEKLGLAYGVLACATTDGTFNGDVNVDMREFRALMRIMRTMATEDINPPDEHKARAGGPKLEQAGAMARGAPARDRPKPRLPRQ
jgi:capsular polysaccharide biosynthesis protein